MAKYWMVGEVMLSVLMLTGETAEMKDENGSTTR